MARRCTKRAYRSAGAARAAMRQMQAAGLAEGDCSPYPCPACGAWHWGHRTGAHIARGSRTIRAIDRALQADAASKPTPDGQAEGVSE